MNASGDLSKSHFFNLQDGTIVALEQSFDDKNSLELQPEGIVDQKYQIISSLGQGGMGAVYRARHLMLDKDVALKTFRTTNLTEEACLRFQREAQAIAKLNHKHVVQVFDYGLFEDGVPYYTMEFLLGQSLAERIKKQGPLEVEQTIEIFTQICQGLSLAHSKGIIHRDLKPGNLFIESTLVPRGKIDTIKIVDFGIASLTNQTYEGQQLTAHGTIFGSPLYMSPEQSLGRHVTTRSDIYSLGCSLFESLTGVPPFRGNQALDTVMMHHNDVAPTLAAAAGDRFPPELERLVAKMLEKKPEKRPASIDQVAAELLAVKECARAGHFLTQATPGGGDGSRRLNMPAGIYGNPGGQESTGSSEAGSAALPRWLLPLAVACVTGILIFAYYAFTPLQSQNNVSKTQKQSGIATARGAATVDDTTKTASSSPTTVGHILRSVEKGTDGKEHVVLKFPPGLVCGLFYSILNPHWRFSARGTVTLDGDVAPIFEPAESFFLIPDGLQSFQSNDLWGLNMDKCQREQKGKETIRQIGKLSGLHFLDLSESDATNSDAKVLGQLNNIDFLSLNDTNISGSAVGTMANLKRLATLRFSRCQDTSGLLTKLQGSRNMQCLYLESDYLGAADFKKISTLPCLRKLYVNESPVSQNDLECLGTMPKLEFLTCRKSKLTWTNLEPLRAMKGKSLRAIDIRGCNLSPKQIREIKQLLPDSEIADGEFDNLNTLSPSVWKDWGQ